MRNENFVVLMLIFSGTKNECETNGCPVFYNGKDDIYVKLLAKSGCTFSYETWKYIWQAHTIVIV